MKLLKYYYNYSTNLNKTFFKKIQINFITHYYVILNKANDLLQ